MVYLFKREFAHHCREEKTEEAVNIQVAMALAMHH